MSDAAVQTLSKRRRLTHDDAKAIADLVAKRLTETEACVVLGIRPEQWFQFKCRKKTSAMFEQIVSRVKGEKIRACMETLEDAGTRVNEKTGQIDWRAHDRLLDRLDPQRFEKQAPQVNVTMINGAPNDLVEAARQAFLRQSTPQSVVSCGHPSKGVIDITPQEVVSGTTPTENK